MKKNIVIILLLVSGLSFFVFPAAAEENVSPKIDYGQDLVLDSDLDGLTDRGETEIFKTDPENPDTDSDGFLDGAEVLNHTDPLDNTSPAATRTVTETTASVEKETAWPWYVARATGLLSFVLLYIVMFLGLSIRLPFMKKIIQPVYSLEIHAWLSVQALLLVLVHGGSLLFDKFLKFNLADVLIPFASQTYTTQIAIGILAMYLLVILILTSYFKRFISHKLWRWVHFMNVLFYGMAVYHGLTLGTDLSGGTLRTVFIWANAFLVLMILANIFSRVFFLIRNRRQMA